MAEAAFAGAGASARMVRAHDVTPDDFLVARGYLFVAPENLGALTGAMKEMFDLCYYPLLGRIEGRPYATMIAAGSDGSGAERQIDRIVTGWRLRRIAEPFIVNFAAQTPESILAAKILLPESRQRCSDIGSGFAEGMQLGIY